MKLINIVKFLIIGIFFTAFPCSQTPETVNYKKATLNPLKQKNGSNKGLRK